MFQKQQFCNWISKPGNYLSQDGTALGRRVLTLSRGALTLLFISEKNASFSESYKLDINQQVETTSRETMSGFNKASSPQPNIKHFCSLQIYWKWHHRIFKFTSSGFCKDNPRHGLVTCSSCLILVLNKWILLPLAVCHQGGCEAGMAS